MINVEENSKTGYIMNITDKNLTFHHTQGSKWVFLKRSEKCIEQPRDVWGRGSGGRYRPPVESRGEAPWWDTPPKALGFLGNRRTNHFLHLVQTPTPLPKQISLQIYTDLKNGPGSWKKVWNQTKVWKFWSLILWILWYSMIKKLYIVFFSCSIWGRWFNECWAWTSTT